MTEERRINEAKYLGKTIIVTINDPWHPMYGVQGVVEHVDDMGQLHGTWGGLAVVPGVDDIEIIK